MREKSEIRLKEDFRYVENRTLLGKKLVVGLKNSNSYVQIPEKYRESFYTFVYKIQNNLTRNRLSDQEMTLYELFRKHGYFEGAKDVRPSFNEYNSLVKVFWKMDFPKSGTSEVMRWKKGIVYCLFFLICVLGTLIFFQNYQYVDYVIDLRKFSVLEIVLSITLVPCLIDGIHEFGHFVMARLLGIEPKDINIGFFVTWPVIYIRYKGLNLNSTLDKVCVLSGGVIGHLAGIVIGKCLLMAGVDSNVLSIWIVANVSMIVSNLLPGLPGDGYFILASVIGIFNLRYKGYKNLFLVLKNGRKLFSKDVICPAIMLGLWIHSFIGIFKSMDYYGKVFMIQGDVIIIAGIIYVAILAARFLWKLSKMRRQFEVVN